MAYNATMLLIIALVISPCSFGLQYALPLPSGRQQIGCRLNHFTSRKSSLYVHSGERDLWEAQREEANAALERMDALESSIRLGESSLTSLKEEILQVEQDVTRLTSELLPPLGLSLEEYKAAIRFYFILPPSIKVALCEVIELPEAAKDWTRVPEIVSRLHEQRRTLTPTRLKDAMQSVETRMSSGAARNIEQEAEEIVSLLLDGKSLDEFAWDNLVKRYLGRVTRKEGKSATEQELQVLMNVLDSSTFVPNGKAETIPGGYMIQGRNVKSSGKELIVALDAKLPSQWTAQVSFMPGFTDDKESGLDLSGEPVLILLHKDFNPTTSRWILSFSTAAAFATAFLFGVGCYGANDNVAQHLQDLTAVGDYSGVNWFNNLLAQLLLPLVIIQGMHELGHLLVAWRDKIKTSPPTLLPFWVLPFMGAVTQLKTSPKNLTSLFDFAFLGPFCGLFTSLVFLTTGMQSTLLADADAAQYFPHLPVNVLQLSTLGGSIVDFFYGGNGMITMQSAAATVPLHPLAIAGFCGIIINSLEMLPLGSSDGGRLSQALFGRSTHAVVGGVTWFSLLVSSFLLNQQDVLIGAWVVFNIAQNDMELPCRDEVDKVNLPRSLAAFSLWFVAILAITPMGISV